MVRLKYFPAIGAVGVAVLGLALARPYRGTALAGQPEPVATIQPGHCEVVAEQSHSPDTLRVGEEVAVTLSVRTVCGDNPADIVLAVDGSVGGGPGEDMIEWADQIVGFMESLTPLVRVGVVEYDDVATPLCELMHDPEPLRACLFEIVPSGTRRPESGLREAAAMLERGRHQDDELADMTTQNLILFMGGPPDPDCAASEAASSEALALSHVVSVVCTGPECGCTRRVSATVRHYYHRYEWSRFKEEIDSVIKPIYPSRVVISTTLSAAMEAAGSAPAPSKHDGLMSEWMITENTNSASVTYRARPSEPGRQLVSTLSGAQVYLRRRGGGVGPYTVSFEPVVVDVIATAWLPVVVRSR